MPKRAGKSNDLDPLSFSPELQTALEALYGHYKKTDLWKEKNVRVPPCFIIVCNNTSTSKLIYDYISGPRRGRYEQWLMEDLSCSVITMNTITPFLVLDSSY